MIAFYWFAFSIFERILHLGPSGWRSYTWIYKIKNRLCKLVYFVKKTNTFVFVWNKRSYIAGFSSRVFFCIFLTISPKWRNVVYGTHILTNLMLNDKNTLAIYYTVDNYEEREHVAPGAFSLKVMVKEKLLKLLKLFLHKTCVNFAQKFICSHQQWYFITSMIKKNYLLDLLLSLNIKNVSEKKKTLFFIFSVKEKSKSGIAIKKNVLQTA